MARFRYRMQNILDIKGKLEEQAKITYGIAQQKYMTEQEKLQEMVVRRTGYERKLKKLMEILLPNTDMKFLMAMDTLLNLIYLTEFFQVQYWQR